MNMYKIEREVEYKGVIYKVVEELQSEFLLVVKKEDFLKGIYPMQTFLIPLM